MLAANVNKADSNLKNDELERKNISLNKEIAIQLKSLSSLKNDYNEQNRIADEHLLEISELTQHKDDLKKEIQESKKCLGGYKNANENLSKKNSDLENELSKSNETIEKVKKAHKVKNIFNKRNCPNVMNSWLLDLWIC